jgi:hypothetical protein
LCATLVVAVALVTMTACNDDDDDVLNGGGGGTTGGGADIDVTSSTPASGDTNISGTGVTVTRETFTGNGTGGFDNGVEYTRIQVDATSDGNARRVLVYFESASGTPKAVSYFWGATDINDNIVYCPAAGCTGVTVNTTNKEIFFSSTALDNNDPLGGSPTKFATLSLGGIQYL